jgi:signal transduction histidine kinase
VDDDSYLWIECTLCKGVRMTRGNEFEYDVKMVARNIDDRKKRAQYQTMIENTEEKGRVNESKMRYISCIAHDLKTPLQSFCFTMDLLGQTRLHTEQREFVQQALVAVDLMKLTISQTMDISKALTGAKLLPRRTTVYLSSVIQRVKVIM